MGANKYTHLTFLVIFLAIMTVPDVFSLKIDDTVKSFENKIDDYNENKLTVSQLITFLEFQIEKSENYLKQENMEGYPREEAIRVLGEDLEYSNFILFETDDFNVRLSAWSVGSDYWDPHVDYRQLHFQIEPKLSSVDTDGTLKQDIENLMEETVSTFESKTLDLEELHERYSQVQSRINEGTRNECEAAMDSIKNDVEMFVENLDGNKVKRYYTHLIRGTNIEECEAIRCDSDYFHYGDGYTCHDDCLHPNNWDFISFQTLCTDDGGSVTISSPLAEGAPPPPRNEHDGEPDPEFERRIVQFVQEFESLDKDMRQECITPMYEANIHLRTLFQESFNEEFMEWYVEYFISDDLERTDFGEKGFRRVLDEIMEINEEIHNDLHCKKDMSQNPSQYTWPEEFEEIEIDYRDDNVELEVWENFEDYRGINTWSTFYRYKFHPEREIAKKLLVKEIEADIQSGQFGPLEEDIEEMRSDEDFLDILNALTDRFGGSIDFKFTIIDEDESFFEKFVQINDEKIIDISSDELKDIDFTLEIDYEYLYDFTRTINDFESRRIHSQFWVEVDYDTSPSFVEGISTIVRLWGGVSVSPWTTKFKLVRSIRDVIEFIQAMDKTEERRPGGRTSAPEITETKDIEKTGTDYDDGEKYSESVSVDGGDSIQFMFETPAGATQMTAINLDSGMPSLHYDSDDSETIILADKQTAWMRSKGQNEWTELTQAQSWDSIWEMYYEDQFKYYHSMIQETDADEITEHSITIYNIDRDPHISSTLFNID